MDLNFAFLPINLGLKRLLTLNNYEYLILRFPLQLQKSQKNSTRKQLYP